MEKIETVGVDFHLPAWITLSTGEKIEKSIWQIARFLSSTYETVCTEAINEGIPLFKKLFWSIHRECLKTGSRHLWVDKYFPSSQICNCCGHRRTKIPPSVKTWHCLSCGEFHDRDINAAINIRAEALRLSLCSN